MKNTTFKFQYIHSLFQLDGNLAAFSGVSQKFILPQNGIPFYPDF